MRVPSFLKSPHPWGLLGTALIVYVLVFIAGRHVDVGWMFPTRQIADEVRAVWFDLPFFTTQETTTDNGQEIRYTVPTHTITAQEMARMGMTNHVAQPKPPAP